MYVGVGVGVCVYTRLRALDTQRFQRGSTSVREPWLQPTHVTERHQRGKQRALVYTPSVWRCVSLCLCYRCVNDAAKTGYHNTYPCRVRVRVTVAAVKAVTRRRWAVFLF